LPNGWKDRVVVVKNENTNGIAGLCLEVHDLAISKLVAARSKDFEFIQELIRHEMIRKNILLTRMAETVLYLIGGAVAGIAGLVMLFRK
jgi:hypothetical protein